MPAAYPLAAPPLFAHPSRWLGRGAGALRGLVVVQRVVGAAQERAGVVAWVMDGAARAARGPVREGSFRAHGELGDGRGSPPAQEAAELAAADPGERVGPAKLGLPLGGRAAQQ